MSNRRIGVFVLIAVLGIAEIMALSLGHGPNPIASADVEPVSEPAPDSARVTARDEPKAKPAPKQEPKAPPPPAPAPAAAVPARGKTLAENPGTHFDDEIGKLAAAQWNREQVDPVTAPRRESAVRDLFESAEASAVLRDVECRETLCELLLSPDARSHEQNGAKQLAGKLGSSAAVVENNPDGVVVLIPGADIALD